MKKFILICLGVSLIIQYTNGGEDSDENQDQSLPGDSSKESQSECQLLKNRLENLEAAVRSIVSALATQQDGKFSRINQILQKDPALHFIFPSSNSSDTSSVNQTLSAENTETDEKENQLFSTELLDSKQANYQLKGSIKCSLAQMVDINLPEGSVSGGVNATLVSNNSLQIEWTSPTSSECLQYQSGLWARVFESGQQPSSFDYIEIPQECLDRIEPSTNNNNTFSFIIHSKLSSNSTADERPCQVELKSPLIECRSYTVQVSPNYQSLKGQSHTTEIVIPSAKSKTTNMESEMNVASISVSKLNFDWIDNSGCAAQLTSFNLNISPGGRVNNEPFNNNSLISIPRACLKQSMHRTISPSFAFTLSSDDPTCPVQWRPLDKCRKYKVEMKSEYSDIWTGVSSVREIFTSKPIEYSKLSDFWKCPVSQFQCRRLNNYRQYQYHTSNECFSRDSICNRNQECEESIDEKNCDQVCANGFKCGKQCIPHEKVCNKEFDCLDGSDEHYDCDYSISCDQLTIESGELSSSSNQWTYNYEDQSNIIHASYQFGPARKTIALVSAKANHTVWLHFKRFATEKTHFIKVYDGPYSTSKLLLSHSGSNQSLTSVRSSQNELYIEYPSYHLKKNKIQIYFTSMPTTGQLYVPGCGGYIYGDGIISSSSNPDIDSKGMTDGCVWYVEAQQTNGSVILKRIFDPSDLENKKKDSMPAMTIYDGWSSSGQLLYETSLSRNKSVIFSISQKVMIHFRSPKGGDKQILQEEKRFHWNISSISSNDGTKTLNGASGTITSPDYPASYRNNSDCRWAVTTAFGTKIRLILALFQTQEGFDYVQVYDGPTMNSTLILEKSGSVTSPVILESSTNQLLIRFTSDDTINFPGFLIVYSTIY